MAGIGGRGEKVGGGGVIRTRHKIPDHKALPQRQRRSARLQNADNGDEDEAVNEAEDEDRSEMPTPSSRMDAGMEAACPHPGSGRPSGANWLTVGGHS